jgi:hypothetical protein
MHQIHAGLDKGQCSARVFFADFKKGFDLVDHNVIITEFERLGVHPVMKLSKVNPMVQMGYPAGF